MCGIVGVYTRSEAVSERKMELALKQMSDQILHRGPDGSGIWVEGKVGFAHRRLAIIDLNERAAQPMHTEDRALVVTFNGEIYNFQDLRRQLQDHGHVFRTESDTEVLLHGYRQWGQDLPSRLRGMFAFAIWDRVRQELFMARDRFGKKPLVYAWCGDTLVFGSEAKSLLEWPGFERQADLSVIHDYMSFGYTPGEHTAFMGMRRLQPAHQMLLRPEHGPDNPPQPKRYWSLAKIDPDKANMTRDQAAAEFLERFDEALRLRLIADVPLGAFLSGGVDSSAVVARMAGIIQEPIKTFSVGFDIGGFDETEYAREVAEQYQTEHRSFKMDYSLIETLPEIIWHYGEPYSDSSSMVSTALSHKIREHVTVAVSGDGGDEILLGYSRYQRFLHEVEQLRAGNMSNAPAPHSDSAFGPGTIRDRYFRYIATFRDLHKQWGYGPALMDYYLTPSADRLPSFLEDVEADNAIDHAARAEVQTYLPDDLLIKTDIATMAASIEGRSPFLDHELADWCASLPQHLRVFERHGKLEMKALLKYAMEPQLSHNILYRKKQGFSVPVKHWLRNEIRELTGDLLTSKSFLERGYLRPEFVTWMLDRHFSGREDHGTRIWNLLCLELWHQTFLERRDPGPMPISIGSRAASQAMVG
ncbi:MAG: asparagine synthase (glutamine-hydrolyzing) [Rhodobacterales bacterium]|nr:MAG: asparagine synthase (glutamine-hydrolyzing) [Rhodobacterales bacterium]